MQSFSMLDLSQRLQQLVTGWRGDERGESLSVLHEQCRNAGGPNAWHLLPAMLLMVKNLNAATLREAIRSANGRIRGVVPNFPVSMAGRFDSALVPIGAAGEAPDRWLLALEAGLALRDQVALYGHVLGHLLLNREAEKLGHWPPLDPRDGYAHCDVLAELRLLETTPRLKDQRVLETYPQLTALLRVREVPFSHSDPAIANLRQQLARAGWHSQMYNMPYKFTDGRIFISENGTQRGRKLQVDALLRAEASLPIAVVQTRRNGQIGEEVELRLCEYAHTRFALPFAYLIDEDGSILEFDWTTSEQPVRTALTALPARDDLLERWLKSLGLDSEEAKRVLCFPYDLNDRKPPRYYQEAAINRAVIAVLQARQGLRVPRILLTLATGTGKTKVAFQLAWKLKRSRAIRKILFLTDRDYLLSQAMDNDFAPFGEARERIRGEARTARDILFANYQAIADSGDLEGLYREYPRNFFDVVIVDECHRGSAKADSTWRDVLEHFSSAVQIGLTATPLSSEVVQTDKYFGKPLYTYSLRTGVNDGFLAPYRVHYVKMGPSSDQEGHTQELPGPADAATLQRQGTDDIEQEREIDSELIMSESAKTMRSRTEVIAQHLADYLCQTNPFAKTIVFCVDQPHAEAMRQALEKACAELVQRYPNYVERIVSEEGIEGRRALGRFSTPDERTPVIVTTSRLLSTGVDIPTCENIVLARPVGTMVEFKQIIGRGTRLYGEKKTRFTVIDYAGAIKLFFDPSFDGDPELVEVVSLTPTSQLQSTIVPVTSETTEGGTPQSPAARIEELQGPPSSQPPPPVAQVSTPMIRENENTYVHPISGEAAAVDQEDTGARTDREQQEPDQTFVLFDDTPPISGSSISMGGKAVPIQPIPVDTPPSFSGRLRDGSRIRVIGEYVYDLAADGRSLRPRLPYRELSKNVVLNFVATPQALKTQWLDLEQREELLEQLDEEGVNLQVLTASLGLTGVDPFDLLLHIAFGQALTTKRERIERLRNEHRAFFDRYNAAARKVLDGILAKYLEGNVDETKDVNDTGLLKMEPIAENRTYMEVAQCFGGGAQVRAALNELQRLLYL